MSPWFDGKNGTYGSFTGYFPDFALKVNPAIVNLGGINDSAFVFVSVPSVKLYSDTAMFSAVVIIPRFRNNCLNIPEQDFKCNTEYFNCLS